MVVAEGSGGGTHRWRRRGGRGGRRNATRERMRRLKWLWTVRVYIPICVPLPRCASLSPYGVPFPSSFLLKAYEALARGELHNSWPYYTPTAASPAYPLSEGRRRHRTLLAPLSLPSRALQPFPSFSLTRVSLSRVHCTSPCMRVLLTLCIRKNLCVCVSIHGVDKVGSDDEVYARVPSPPTPRAECRRIFRLSYGAAPPVEVARGPNERNATGALTVLDSVGMLSLTGNEIRRLE